MKRKKCLFAQRRFRSALIFALPMYILCNIGSDNDGMGITGKPA